MKGEEKKTVLRSLEGWTASDLLHVFFSVRQEGQLGPTMSGAMSVRRTAASGNSIAKSTPGMPSRRGTFTF